MLISILTVAAFSLLPALGDPPPPSQGAQAPAKTGLTITGHVKWTDAKPPRRSKIRMDSDPACVEACQGKDMYSERAIVDEDGNFKDVVVYISKGLPEKAWTPSEKTVLIDQINCRYEPHVVTFQLGQKVEIRNSDDATHNVHLVSRYNGSWSVTQSKKGTIEPKEPFKAAEFEKPSALLKCDIHPWMEARLFIFDHPFHTVTGEDGTFSLNLGDLPPGEYEVTAVQEKYRSATAKVTVAADKPTKVEFTFNKKKQNAGKQVD